jgi:DNA-binding response OmpR family regulator
MVSTLAKILLVEDHAETADSLKRWLENDRHVIEIVSDGAEAAQWLEQYKYDLIIIDWGLPGKDGIQVCKEYRACGGNTPVLMLTARSETDDKLIGLDSGADDYLTKPVEVRELSARIRALLRRPSEMTAQVLTVGPLSLDPSTCSVTKNGTPIQLSQREYALLDFFMRRPNQFFTAEVILERVWSADVDTTPLSVRVYIKKLRDKIDDQEDSLIENIKGVGYRLKS